MNITKTIYSTQDSTFLAIASQRLELRGEIFVVVRYAYAAGSRDCRLFTSFETFLAELRTLPAQANVILMLAYDLPVRGVVDDDLIEEALRCIPAHADFTIVYLNPRDKWPLASEYVSWLSSNYEDTGHDALRERLEETRGEMVAIGLTPDWHTSNPDINVDALVPDAQGNICWGTY